MIKLFRLSGPLCKESSPCLDKFDFQWVVPRAIYATANPCVATKLTVLKMQQLDEKCCHKPESSCRSKESVSGTTMSHNIDLDATCCSKRASKFRLNIGPPEPKIPQVTPSGKPQFYRLSKTKFKFLSYT